ncbi:hypothetical protein L226DRAFT_571838 [Lentinus tigrinus ALCF2SS1-7]|uniref:F-box domain-containing protein n=1 Tax=Lentinus tigrinus ALCF2SS1-6 TaxID=1328759 RepID=A0A5C2RYP3_9APHY|nr:hypothetical protein L227DRAFT_614809 [Lentinus tigrinus ALCF2SS1-6]RPD73936.1 hypothetical protein L226DRAFT_571838 [Lentinus tigrinus ALCF2SS1-7]
MATVPGFLDDVFDIQWRRKLPYGDADTDPAHHAVSLVQETMNARCPINKLPPELLALVFSMVPSSLSLPGYVGPPSTKQTNELLPVTHVCRSWRVLALDMPSLWSTISQTSSVFRTRA